MIHDPDRLQQALGKATLARLIQGIAARLRFGQSLGGTLTLPDVSADERSAIDHFLGRRPSSGTPLVVRLAEMERILCESGMCDSLAEAVQAIAGPIEDQRRARDSASQRWADLFSSIEAEMADLRQYRDWLARIRSTGLLKKYSGDDCVLAGMLLRQALFVLRQLPQPAVPLAELATRTTGDSHALDVGRPLSALCLQAIAQQQGLKLSRSADCRRQLWDSVGVVVDELSAPVLVLNLRGAASTLVGQLLNLMADSGEPCHLTVRQLRRADESVFGEWNKRTVSVCENPSVIAAAAQRLGPRSLPLICTAGQPASAAQLLIDLLCRAGCRLRYHGDLDPPGIAIANMLMQRFAVHPWRMSAADYVSAVSTAGPCLSGRALDAIWDDQLSSQMHSRGKAVLEESVLGLLIGDLERGSADGEHSTATPASQRCAGERAARLVRGG
jgi:uncharacterized protein (TIGR02679 family)